MYYFTILLKIACVILYCYFCFLYRTYLLFCMYFFCVQNINQLLFLLSFALAIIFFSLNLLTCVFITTIRFNENNKILLRLSTESVYTHRTHNIIIVCRLQPPDSYNTIWGFFFTFF